jgi:hypothetical protein
MSDPEQWQTSLRTLADVERCVSQGLRANSPSRWGRLAEPLEFGFEPGRLPACVAQCGALVERAVTIAGKDGLSLQQVRVLFSALTKERIESGLMAARGSGRLIESRELRPDRNGRRQRQIVLRARRYKRARAA